MSQSHFTADSQSVNQSICLGVELNLWTFDQILLPFQELCLKFVVLSLWGTLSDERPGLFFVSHSLVICLCVHLTFTFLSFTHLQYIYIYIYILHNIYTLYIRTIYINYTMHIIYARPLSVPARYSRLCPTTH
jgi:hypothetical protein